MISRARAILTGLTATATLIAVVIGLPVVLYQFGGSPLPRHLAGWHRLASILTSRDNGTLLLAVVRDCSWLAWLLFTIAVLTELQAAARGRAAPRLWLGGMQGGAARLVALAALTFASPSAVTLTASVATVAPAHAGRDHNQGQAALPDPARGTSPGATLDSAAASRLVTVRKGDCLWTIARHYLGAGDRYPEIVTMNYGHDMGDGQVFTNPSLIEPGWRLLVPATDSHDGRDDPSLAGEGPARHLGHPTHDAHFRRQHPTAGLRPAAGRHSAGAQPASAATVPADVNSSSDASGYQTSANVAAAGEHIPEAAAFGAGALASAVLMSLGRLRRRQRQYRRRGRRIALPDDPAVLAAEQRLRAAAPVVPPATLHDALSYLESGITGSGQALPDIVGLHVTPRVLEILLASPALDSPPAPYSISPGRQGMCWQLPLSADSGPVDAAGPPVLSERGSGLLPGLFTAGGTDDGYLLLDLESLQVTGCDGPRELIDQVITAAATELATGQWSGWYDLVLVGFDELEVLGRAEHCASLDAALGLLDARCRATGRRLADQPPADVRQLRLEAPEDEDWGLTILVSRIEPAPDQMTHLLELAEDGPGGIAALVAGDPETADGRMAPTVLQLAPDPQRAGEILANVIPLQIMVRPQVLSGTDYEAIGTLFGAATDLQDVSPQRAPYEVYGAPPWIPQAAQLRPQDEMEGSDWSTGVLVEEAGCADDELGTDEDADADGERPTWHHVSNLARSQWQPTAAPRHGASAPGAGTTQTPADGVAAPPWAAFAGPQDGAAQAPPRLDVRILGSFAITGAAGQLQPKQAELVLALALAAPAGLTNSALCSMLGTDPDHPKPSDAVRQIITRTRRRLGRARDGQEYIIHAGNGSYLLHPDMSLDWTEFRKLTSTARVEDMRAAMALVRGQPFTGSYYWWLDIPLLETVRAEIVDAAETLAEFELATGSARAAARAARAGLTAEASAEQLWRLLMRAEHAGGNLLGVAEAWRRCLDAIEDIAPGGEPHPDTEALYRQLTAGTRQQAPIRG
jgi:DNA-binding SARP family transcriptional activator